MKGETIKNVLYSHNVKLIDVASALGTTKQNLNCLLNGEDVKTSTLERIAQATGISIGEFFGDYEADTRKATLEEELKQQREFFQKVIESLLNEKKA